MRFIHIGIKEKSLIGGNQRNIVFICKIDKVVFRFLFRFQADTRNFHIKAVCKNLAKFNNDLFRFRLAVFEQEPSDLPFYAGGERYQPAVQFFQIRHFELCLFALFGVVEIRALHQLHNVLIAVFVHHQQNDFIRLNNPSFSLEHIIGIRIAQVELTTQNGLYPFIRSIFGKSLAAEHIGGVGYGNRRNPLVVKFMNQLRHQHCAFRQRIGGMNAKMYELWCRHW